MHLRAIALPRWTPSDVCMCACYFKQNISRQPDWLSGYNTTGQVLCMLRPPAFETSRSKYVLFCLVYLLATTIDHRSYNWVNEQRKLALTRAYLLLRRPDGTVGRDDWLRLMSFLRPDCNCEHVSAAALLGRQPVKTNHLCIVK